MVVKGHFNWNGPLAQVLEWNIVLGRTCECVHCITMKMEGGCTTCPHKSQLLGSLLSDADLFEVTVTKVLQLPLDTFSTMPSFISVGQTLWCLTYRTLCCFDLSTFCGSERSRNIHVVLCTNTIEAVHQRCHLAHAQHIHVHVSK